MLPPKLLKSHSKLLGILIISIVIYMKTLNKPENISEEINLYKQNVIFSIIFTLLILTGLIILTIPADELDFLSIVIICSISASQVYVLIVSLLIENKYIFDHTGFTYLERNKINAKEIKKTYRWEDIRYMKYSLNYKYCRSFLVVVYKGGMSNDEIRFPYGLSKRFTKLAIKYSGRNNIVRSGRKKRKMYEKDW